MNTLYLSAAERSNFEGLPSALQEGWSVVDVRLVEEDEEVLQIRSAMARFTDPRLSEAWSALRSAKTAEEFGQASAIVNFKNWDLQQLAELFFVLGVRTISGFIGYMLSACTTDEDIEGIAALSHIRSMLSETNSAPAL